MLAGHAPMPQRTTPSVLHSQGLAPRPIVRSGFLSKAAQDLPRRRNFHRYVRDSLAMLAPIRVQAARRRPR